MPPAAHTYIGTAITLAQDHRQLGHRHQRHRVHEIHDLARGTAFLGFGADLKAGRIDEQNDRNIERIAQHQKVDDLAAGIGVERAAAMQRIVGDDADAFAAETRERDDCAFAETRFQLEQAVLVDQRLDHALHVVHLRAFLRQDGKHLLHVRAGTRGHRRIRRRFAVMARHIGEKTLERGEHLLLGIDDLVDEPGDFGVHAPAAEFFEIDFSAERHFYEARTRHCHGGALLHHGEIREAGQPRGRAERRADDGHRERRFARAPELRVVVAQQHAHAARTHRIGQPRAGRFTDDDKRHAALGRRALHMADFLAVGSAGRSAFDGEVVDDDGDIAAVDAREAGDLAVGLRFRFLLRVQPRCAEEARFDKTAGVDQRGDALARIQLFGLLAPGEFIRAAHGERPGAARCVFLEKFFECHVSPDGLFEYNLVFSHAKISQRAFPRRILGIVVFHGVVTSHEIRRPIVPFEQRHIIGRLLQARKRAYPVSNLLL